MKPFQLRIRRAFPRRLREQTGPPKSLREAGSALRGTCVRAFVSREDKQRPTLARQRFQEQMSSYKVRVVNSDEALEVCTWREEVPALHGARTPVLVERKEAGRQGRYVVVAGGKRYEGLPSRVGNDSSCYAAVSVKPDGTMTFTRLSALSHAFRPERADQDMDLEEVEMRMMRADKANLLADSRLERLLKTRKDDEDDEDDEDPDARADKKKKTGKDTRSGKKDSGGGAAVMDDDDEFDDGAGPGWAARADAEEDGNDGLDMDVNMFEDDEDDTFAASKEREMQFGCVSTDREESEAFQAAEDSRAQYEERRIKLLADLAQEKEERGIARAGDDDDEEELERAPGETEWGRLTKEDLREERAQRRLEQDSEADDDDDLDDDEQDGIKLFLRQSAAAAEGSGSPAAAAAGEAAAAPAAGKATIAGGKRAISLGGGTAVDGAPDDVAIKRAKHELERTAVAVAAAGGVGSLRVTEKDVALSIHRCGQMRLKEVLTAFEAYRLQSQAHKEHLYQLIKAVACVTEKDGFKYAELTQAALVKYGLE